MLNAPFFKTLHMRTRFTFTIKPFRWQKQGTTLG
jgi:hypothetical protein